jgi:hypothetical protein
VEHLRVAAEDAAELGITVGAVYKAAQRINMMRARNDRQSTSTPGRH